ncbi:hypothetical protein [Mucilaginibacter sp. UYCu711]|uniref:hypothetical protein n=1 Tax=Mucilaginibacter sp. UYCu711 TaxID=3156339 RepID=UPI003D2052CE
MIENFLQLKSNSVKSDFQFLILRNIEEMLDGVNISLFSQHSFIDTTKDSITISLVHKDDSDTIATLNIFTDRISLWYGSCEINFDSFDLDINYFKDVYQDCLNGNYITTDFFLRNKLIYSSTTLTTSGKKCLMPFFYRLYIKFYQRKFTSKQVHYKSFSLGL